jgi:hypothetical protein
MNGSCGKLRISFFSHLNEISGANFKRDGFGMNESKSVQKGSEVNLLFIFEANLLIGHQGYEIVLIVVRVKVRCGE